MKAVLCGDIHFSDHGPSTRTETYCQDILDKFSFVVNQANHLNVDVLILLGDIFHHKAPSKTSHSLVQRVMDLLDKAMMPVYIVVGNHCIQHDRLDSLPKQPLGVLLRMSNVHQLQGYVPEFDIIGVPYCDNPDDWGQYIDLGKITPKTLVCMHASIFPESEMPPYEAISAEDLSSMLPEVNYFSYGHIHTPPKKGPYYKAGSAWFCNRGAISRGSLHGENLKRSIGVTLFDSEAEGCPFTEIPVPYKPAEEVFKLEEKQMAVESKERVTEFLESVGSVETGFLTREGIKDHVLSTLGVKSHTLLDEIFEEVE